MQNDKIITFKTFYDPMLAHVIRTRIEAQGIPCFLSDENFITAQPIFNQATGGIKLNVFEHDLDKCQAILTEEVTLNVDEPAEIDPDTHQVMVCPFCASSNVRYGQATERRFNMLTLVVSLFLFVYPFYNRKSWHCFNCESDFE